MTEFKDKFTLDGLVMPPKGVTKESVGKVAEMLKQAKMGDYVAEARLKESLMSGSLASSVAHVINLITIPQLPPTKERPVAAIAGRQTVQDFRPATLAGIYGHLEGPGVDKPGYDGVGSAPRVPQGTPYPVATLTGIESAYSKLAKRGLRVNWDFEDFINDTVGTLDRIPGELQRIALQTEWQEVGDALVSATTSLASQTLPDDTVVPINSPLTANGILAAIQQLSLTLVHGAYIGTLSGYTVVVPIGRKPFIDFKLRQAMGITAILPVSTAGGPVYIGPDNSILGTITTIEHEAVTGTNWYLLPKPGAYSRPVIDVLSLRGYETPQIRVKTEGGDGFSFDTDSASMRLRLVTGAALWFNEVVVHSNGTSA